MKLPVEMEFKTPRMPNFLIVECEGERTGVPVGDLSEDAAEIVAEEMASAFLDHWKKKRALAADLAKTRGGGG